MMVRFLHRPPFMRYSRQMISSLNLKTEDAAWLAGYIDGDGCICLSKKGGRERRTPILVIDSADREILEYVQTLVGGTVIAKKRYSGHHRQTWTWRLYGTAKVIDVLRVLRPFLRCAFKAERARMLVDEWAACTPRNGFYTEGRLNQKVLFEQVFMSIGEGRGSRSRLPA